MNKDLWDDVLEGIETEVGGGDPERYYATAEAMKAFGRFLAARRWYDVNEILQEMRPMMLNPAGDFRDEFDDIIKEH